MSSWGVVECEEDETCLSGCEERTSLIPLNFHELAQTLMRLPKKQEEKTGNKEGTVEIPRK